MLSQKTYHPDVTGWQVDDDLRRARIFVTARTRIEQTTNTSGLEQPPTTTEPHRPRLYRPIEESQDRRDAIIGSGAPDLKIKSVKRDASTRSAKNELKVDYPTSRQGGWRPWIFVAAGLIGGNIAMSLGMVSPNYLPTIVIGEAILGLFMCFTFYPRWKSNAQAV